MRQFSEEEKDFIRLIEQSSGHESNLMNLLMPFLNREGAGVLVSFDHSPATVTILFRPGGQSKEKCQRIQRLIARMAYLVRDLEQTGHIITINPTSEQVAHQEFGGLSETSLPLPPLPWILPDETTKAFMLTNFNKEFVPTPLLTSLVKNGFKSEEDIKFRKQQVLTLVAVVIAALTSIGSLTFSGCQARLSRHSVETQGWQYVVRQGSDIARVYIDHPNLRPFFYEGKPLDPSDPNFNVVMTLAEMYLDYFESFLDKPIRSLEGMEEGGKNWVCWEQYFRDTFAASPVLCSLSEQVQSQYTMDFAKYRPTRKPRGASSTGQQATGSSSVGSVAATAATGIIVVATNSPSAAGSRTNSPASATPIVTP